MTNAYVLSKKMYGECTHTYIYISNRIDFQCTHVQKHIDDLDYMLYMDIYDGDMHWPFGQCNFKAQQCMDYL